MDESQIEKFISEVVILTQVSHKNVVELLRCYVECDVSLFIYEFVSNGTLLHNIHIIDGGTSWSSFQNQLKFAAESSGVLVYLHLAASTHIIHRNVNLANIIVDDYYVAEASKLNTRSDVTLNKFPANDTQQIHY